MSQSTNDPGRARPDQPDNSRPASSGTDAGNAAPADDSNLGEEDPGAALDDPEVRDAMRKEGRTSDPAQRGKRDGA